MPKPTYAELMNRFGYHKATGQTGPMHETVRELYLEFATTIMSNMPDCAEMDEVIRYLDLAMMYTNAGIARTLAPLEDNDELELQ